MNRTASTVGAPSARGGQCRSRKSRPWTRCCTLSGNRTGWRLRRPTETTRTGWQTCVASCLLRISRTHREDRHRRRRFTTWEFGPIGTFDYLQPSAGLARHISATWARPPGRREITGMILEHHKILRYRARTAFLGGAISASGLGGCFKRAGDVWIIANAPPRDLRRLAKRRLPQAARPVRTHAIANTSLESAADDAAVSVIAVHTVKEPSSGHT